MMNDEAESCCIESCDHTDSEDGFVGSRRARLKNFQMTCNNCGADGYENDTLMTISWEHYDKT